MQTDHELLSQYTRSGSEEAFGELVRRHTDLVYAACLRIVRDPHLAEDATQATFLVLVRRGKTIAAGESLAGWLYRVAVNAARNAQRMATRRTSHERQAGEAAVKTVEAAQASQWDDVAPYLDAALNALPRAQRDAIITRCLLGLTQAQAAAALNCPPETVHTRVNRGLEKLRALLSRKDVRLSAAALALLLEKTAQQHAPPALASSIQAACLGKTAASLTASTLATEVAKSMVWIKPVTLAACAGCMALLAAIFMFHPTTASRNASVVQPPQIAAHTFVVAPPPQVEVPPPESQTAQTARAAASTNGRRGSQELMLAVDGSMAWLEKVQEQDGHFDCQKFGGAAGQDVAVTSIAAMTMLGAGHTRKVGRFKATVTKAVLWLEQQPPPDDITQAALRTMTLAESMGMSRLGGAQAQSAVDDLIARQNITGEWLDENSTSAYERSVGPTTWAVLALKSAKVSGLNVPPASLEQAVTSFELQQREVMINEDNIAGAKMAAGLAVQRQFTGSSKDDPNIQKLVTLLPKQQPRYPSGGIGHEIVFWWQGSLAMFNQGGEGWNDWCRSLREALLPSQIKDGELAGSWDFRQGSDPFVWGRVGSTALAALPLEVEARYLQLQPDRPSESPYKRAHDNKALSDDAAF
jgi:RNA polymerase sigma factor (sigma-70 family)